VAPEVDEEKRMKINRFWIREIQHDPQAFSHSRGRVSRPNER
jgi:hypothetical protein